jgi:hypothetical protein
MIDDLLDARDDLEAILDEALPALEARPRAEAAEMLAVLLVAPLRRRGPEPRLRRLVVRRLAQRATPAAAAVLEAIAALADDDDTGDRARAALAKLAADGVAASVEGVGGVRVREGWRFAAPAPAEQLAATLERPGEAHPHLLKLWFDPGEGDWAGAVAGGWTDPIPDRRLRSELAAFGRRAGAAGDPEPLDAAAFAAEVDRVIRGAADRNVPLTEGIALVLPQLRRAVGSPRWPAFEVVAPDS